MAQGIYRIDPPQPQQAGPFVPIPVQGQQPPFIGQSLAQTMAILVAAWPTGMEPGLPQPDFHKARIAPLTLTYGQQPPPPYGMLDEDVICWVNRTWQPPDPPPQRDLKRTAPLALVYGDQPPVVSGTADVDIGSQIWTQAWQPPPPQPQQEKKNLAPLTLVYGDQPPRIASQWQIAGAWKSSDFYEQQEQGIAALIPVLVVQPPFVAYPMSIVAAWQDAGGILPRPVAIAPLTLTYGQQPPLLAGHLVRQRVIRENWEPGPPLPTLPQLKYQAPLALVYGQQPPRYSINGMMNLVASNQPPYPPPVQRKNNLTASGAANFPSPYYIILLGDVSGQV